MNCIGIVAEEMDHHPDWFNVYNQLKVNLNTHDALGVTIRDLCLATICEELFNIIN
jgi:4a-hydroxytetrahydrobiopterin dehydratase